MEKEKRKKKSKKKIYLIVLLIAISLIIPTMFLINAALWTGNQAPFVYWKFDQDAGTLIPDSSTGTNYSGNGVAGIGSVNWIPGLINNGLQLNETHAFQVTQATLLDVPTQDFSVQLWFKPNQTFTAGSSDEYLFSKTNVIAQERLTCRLDNTGGFLICFGEGAGAGGFTLTSSVSSWTAGQWYHLVFVWDDSGGNVYQYVNGVQNGTTAYTDQLGAGTDTDFNIGNLPATAERFNGTVDEFGIWNRSLTAGEALSLYNEGVGLPFGGVGTLTINSPADGLGFLIRNITFNLTGDTTSINEDIDNMTLYINSVLNDTNELTGLTNTTTFNKSVIFGTYNWFARMCTNVSICVNTTVRTFTRSPMINVGESFNSTTYETAREIFIINITSDGAETLTGKLVYNGTTYTGTKTGNDTNATFTATIDIPAKVQNKSFHWDISYGSITTSTTDLQQKVSLTSLGLCNTTLAQEYVNISFKDEESLANINGTIPASTWTYYIGSGTETKALSFINNTANYNYEFCASPNTSIFKINPSVQYASSGYPQRVWNPGAEDYDNASTNKVLYLLSSATGQDVTFQVINSVNQVLSGVDVTINRTIDSVVTTVGSGTTGAEGSLTFFLSKNFIHDFTFEKTGFTTQQLSFAPTQTAYTITLAGGTDALSEDFTKGINASILPSAGTELFNSTTYNFNYSLTSSFWDVSAMGFILKLPNGTILGATNQASTGFLSLNFDTANYSIIVMDYFWTINDTNVTRTTRWNVMNTELTDWSIKNFFTDFNAYLDAGIFGIDNFGRYLIIFLILFISVGVMSFKFGLTSPMTIISLIFAIIFFFDVAVGLLPNPVGAVPNFPTFIAALILIITIFREVTR